MSIERAPFVNYTLGEKNPLEQGKIFTVRLNVAEYIELLAVMKALNISSESTALKELAFMGKKVIFTLFEPKTLKWLTDNNRRINEAKLNKLDKDLEQNVTQKEAIL